MEKEKEKKIQVHEKSNYSGDWIADPTKRKLHLGIY